MQTTHATHDAPGENLAKAATGIKGLDPILEGGLPVGRTVLVNGGPGTGKSVLALEFLYRGALDGEPGVFISFEERADDIRRNGDSLGMNIAALERAGKMTVIYAEPPAAAIRTGDFDIRGLLSMMEGRIRSLAANRLVLDAIDVLMRIFGDPEREREELHILHAWLRERELTALVTVKTAGDRQVYPFLDFMADCVLRLDQRIEGQVRTRRLCVMKYRGSKFLSNEHPFVITPDGVVLIPVQSINPRKEVVGKRVPSGNETLDKILGGGYQRGSCILLGGPSGVGKSSLACTFVNEVCARGECAVYVSFEESQAELIANMRSSGMDLQPFLDSGRLHCLTALPESAGIEEHLLWIMNALERWNPRHFVLDAISSCKRMGAEHAAFDFIIRLLLTCKSLGITCLFTNQTVEPTGIMHVSGIGVSSLADTLIGMQYVDDAMELQRRLLVIKSRGTSHSLRHHRLMITDRGLCLEPLTNAANPSAGENHRL